MMIENYRTELIWRLMRNCRYLVTGLQARGISRRMAITACSQTASYPHLNRTTISIESALKTCARPIGRNPTPLDRYKFLIIGAGPAGLVAAHAAAALGAKVALVERELLGGDCLNVGCVPSKTIIRTARLYAEMRKAQHYGAQVPADIRVDFAAVMQRMRARSRPHQPQRFSPAAGCGRGRRFLRQRAIHRIRYLCARRREAALQQGDDRHRRAARHSRRFPASPKRAF